MQLVLVLDTNIIISSLSRRSPYHNIINAFRSGIYSIAVTKEILLEYEEKLQEFYGRQTASDFLLALSVLPNVVYIDPLFRSSLIKDADDNKFLDCAYSANVSYIVSNDRSFDVLSKIEFPKITVLDINEFSTLLNSLGNK